MNALREAISKLLRGPRASMFLRALGVDPRRYWLLVDLFDQISERGEMMDQLGRNGVALKSASLLYFAFSAFLGVIFAVAQPGVAGYLAIFLGITAFLLTSILVNEAGNSLINPQEAMVLAHQPINGATYTAAKLSHLLRIILYLVPGINAIPAFAGLTLKGAAWYYPAEHLAAAFAVGLVAALLCCALFGWMVRFVPVRRLKATAQFAGTVPFLLMMFGPRLENRLAPLQLQLRQQFQAWLGPKPALRWTLETAVCAAIVAAVALGLRSLSADYLIRVSGLTRGGASAGSRAHTSQLGAFVRRFFGGQTAVAGFAFVSRMMLRDWQFRRQILPMLIFPVVQLATIVRSGWPADPLRASNRFPGTFSPIHLLPHALGLLLFFVCGLLRYGNEPKGGWIFRSVPTRAFDGFARGIFAVLWIDVILIPNVIALPLLAWPWGIWHAALFVAYSMAAASLYLALELRLVEAIPFTQQMDKPGQAVTLLLLLGAAIVMAIAVGLQYFLVFRSAVGVAVTAVALALGTYFATKASLSTLAGSMRYHLGVESSEATALYKEIAV